MLSKCLTLERRDWREKQAAEIKARDEASRARRDETVGKAERAIDQFYEEYAAKKERNIRENKCVSSGSCSAMKLTPSIGNTRRNSWPA